MGEGTYEICSRCVNHCPEFPPMVECLPLWRALRPVRCDMATINVLTTTPKSADTFQLPDTPRREPDEMTSFDSLHSLGNSHHIIRHLGNEETTLVFTDKYISLNPILGPDDLRRNPDLVVALNADREAFLRRNGYIISEQGKPPDFALEIASRSTARVDVGQKRVDYAVMGITEYWRFDETGEYLRREAGRGQAGGRPL